MPGLMSHVFFALGGLLLLMLVWDWRYGAGFFVGQILPDAIKFGVPAIRLKTLSFVEMMTDPAFGVLDFYTGNVYLWLGLMMLVVIFGLLFHRFGDFSWGEFKVLVISNVFFFVSVVLHLVLDFYIIEDSFWV